MLKSLALILVAFMSTAAMAGDLACNPAAAEKKLAGAAKTSFLKKCQKDAVAMCQASSKEKKLAGAAKTSHEKKCVKDAIG